VRIQFDAGELTPTTGGMSGCVVEIMIGLEGKRIADIGSFGSRYSGLALVSAGPSQIRYLA